MSKVTNVLCDMLGELKIDLKNDDVQQLIINVSVALENLYNSDHKEN